MIKKLLLSESSQNSTMNIISIAGIGGIGKTTLAQLLLNDDDVKAHFNQDIWVCVSKPFDSIRVARAILESLSGNAQMTRIKEVVTGKRFLLVLDDVWEDGPDRWQQLKHSLSGGLPGSRILVTTRSESVAISMGCTSNNLFHVGKLSADECWSILRQIAFSGKENECELFEPIGKRIVKKCDGLPLAANVLGSILRLKSSLQEWKDVLNSELWELPGIWEGQTGLASLWLSYYDLPTKMRQCFSYCAIFPEDHRIQKSVLIAMWMAQGYLGTTSRIKNAMEKCGDEQFQSLARRCFFQQFCGGNGVYYKMHDVLRDFAQYLKGEECIGVEINNSEEVTELSFLPSKTRHLRIGLGEEGSLPSSIFKLEKLRTFWLESNGKRITEATPSSLVDKLICLRSLILSECGIIEIPASIGKLVHLRQLDLSGNQGLGELHENVCELYNLQTLDISNCCDLCQLPKRMEKLINLRHLVNVWCLSAIPKGVSRLSNLRTLREFVIYSDANDANCGIGDLKNFKNLEGELCIRNLGEVDPEEAKEAQLNKMNEITELHYDFGDSEEREEIKQHHEQVIEALEPSPNVEKLSIYEYKGSKFFPNWLMSLNNLKGLILLGMNCEHLPPLWKLPTLEKLELRNMKGVKTLGGGFVGMESGMNVEDVSRSSSMVGPMAFPKLKSLLFFQMDEMEEWESVEVSSNFTIMPCLSNLDLRRCQKLKALSNYIYQPETLTISVSMDAQ